MKKNEKQKFFEEMTIMAAGLQCQLNAPQMEFYWRSLEDLEIEQIRVAVKNAGMKITETYGKFPLPAKIRELASGYSEEQAEMDALQEWEMVSKSIQAGSYGNFGHEPNEITQAIVRSLGGPKTLGMQRFEDFLKWTRKQFLDEYKKLAKNGVPKQQSLNAIENPQIKALVGGIF